jgi:hypothetical protein
MYNEAVAKVEFCGNTNHSDPKSCSELELLAVSLPFTFRIDLLYLFSHLTPL